MCYGRTKYGRQRYRCKICNRTFTYRNKFNKLYREQKWFKDWIVEGYSLRQINLISGHSIRTLKRITGYWIAKAPPLITLPLKNVKYLVADGTYLKHENCIYAATDYLTGLVASHRYGIKENYCMAHEIFDEIKTRGCKPIAAAIDGNTQVIRALRNIWPTIIIQRCLYHILRQGTSWLRRFPKDPAAKELRQIILTVMTIPDDTAKDAFITRLNKWDRVYGAYVRALDSRHKVWGDLQRARSLLRHALPDMFHYLDDPNIAPTSNMQEGLFSTAKILFRNHRGVSKKNRASYFNWYFYFKNKKIINNFGY